MPIQPGTYRLGPDDATLSVHTRRAGAAAKAGHDLVICVTAWEATLAVGDEPADTTVELSADATSLRVQEGTGGMMPLGDEDVASIHESIDDEVLQRREIAFRSSQVRGEPGGGLHVEGDLALAGETRPIAFDLSVGEDGALRATATVQQTLWGMKPYSALFGALKVKDEVEIVLEGQLQNQSR